MERGIANVWASTLEYGARFVVGRHDLRGRTMPPYDWEAAVLVERMLAIALASALVKMGVSFFGRIGLRAADRPYDW